MKCVKYTTETVVLKTQQDELHYVKLCKFSLSIKYVKISMLQIERCYWNYVLHVITTEDVDCHHGDNSRSYEEKGGRWRDLLHGG